MEVIEKLDKRKLKPRIVGSNKDRVVMINITESSLDLLKSKKVLNVYQYYTALRYRRIWEKSRIGSFTCDFNRIGDGKWNDMAIDRIDAIYKLSQINGYLGFYTSELLYKVCIQDFNLKELSIVYQMPRAYAGHRLREAINELQSFFDKN